MIYVMYQYFSKSEGKYLDGETEFNSPVKALRFMYSIKGREDYFLDGYRCDDPEDDEYIGRRIKLG